MSDRLHILCFGNSLHGDDGFGPAVAQALQRFHPPEHVKVFECGTRGLDALAFFEGCARVVIVDAMAGLPVGELALLTSADLPDSGETSLGHGAGIPHLLASLPEMLDAPPPVHLLVARIAEIKAFAPGLSLPVAAAVGQACLRLCELWGGGTGVRSTDSAEDLAGELDVLRQANGALEQELIHSAEALDALIDEQTRREDELENKTQALAQLNGTIERAIATMAEIFVLLGPDGMITRVNRRFTHELGFAAADMLGRGPECFFDPVSLAALNARHAVDATARAPFMASLRAAGGHIDNEVLLRTSDAGQAPIPYLLHAGVLYSQAGKLEGAVIVATNISAIKKRELELRENQEQLRQSAEELRQHRDHLNDMVEAQTHDLRQAKETAEAASQAKSEFLSNMSHEVRTPLNAVLGISHLMRRAGLPPAQMDRLDKLQTSAQHLLGILNDILDLSKIEAGKMSLEEEPISVRSLMRTVADMVAERAQEKRLTLHVDSDLPGNCDRLLGDLTRLRQALLNYASNAVKFTEHGAVTLAAAVLEDTQDGVVLRLEVRDTGIGIEQAAADRLFTSFEQADGSITRKYGGTGLGLAITRKLIALMGGEVGVNSVVGRGCTFWLTAKLRKQSPVAAAPVAVAAQQFDPATAIATRFGGQRILLVDDEPLNRLVAHAMLSDVGLEVDEAESGQQALECFEQTKYAMVLMDMQMPGLDGLETTRMLRMTPAGRSCPIIAMTANVFAEDRRRCIEAGMDDFLSKPVEPEKLYVTILRGLSRRNDVFA